MKTTLNKINLKKRIKFFDGVFMLYGKSCSLSLGNIIILI